MKLFQFYNSQYILKCPELLIKIRGKGGGDNDIRESVEFQKLE